MGCGPHTTSASFGIEVRSCSRPCRQLPENRVTSRNYHRDHPGSITWPAQTPMDIRHVLLHGQLGWDGKPRPRARRQVSQEWPETLEPLSDTYMDQVYQGPLG
jgi:hypothetical protein